MRGRILSGLRRRPEHRHARGARICGRNLTCQHPALRRLLVDIEAGRVDLVVVYKIDRFIRG